MRNRNTTKLVVLFVAAVLVASAAGPALAALTYDNETTNSGTTSDFVGGELVTDLENESKFKEVQVISDNATTSALTKPEEAFTLEAQVNDSQNSDNNYTFYVNDTATWTVVNASAGHYMLNVSHAELFSQLPRTINEDVTVDLTTTFNKSESDAEAATITITASNGDERVVDAITDQDVAESNDVDFVNESRTLRGNLDFAEVESEDEITENTTVTYVIANGSVSEKYSNAYDVSSFSSGDYLYSMTANAEGKPIMVFNKNVGENRSAGWFSGGFDSSKDSYAVYYNNGGDHFDAQRLDIVPQGEHANETYLSTSSEGNKALGYWANYKNFGGDAASASGFGVVPE